MNSVEDNVSVRIAQLCYEKKLSMYALSERSGVPESTVKSIIYKRSRTTGLSNIVKLAAGLDMSIREFFDDPMFGDTHEHP